MEGSGEKLQVFYDGACPICRREMNHYMKRDVRQRIAWVDIAGRGFVAADHGLDADEIQRKMHARLPDGRIVTGVRAFVEIWKRLPINVVTTPLRWILKVPGMMWVAGKAYGVFARNRYRLTGRCTPESCELPTKP